MATISASSPATTKPMPSSQPATSSQSSSETATPTPQPLHDATRLFHCATAPPSTLHSPTLSRITRCRYPLRFTTSNSLNVILIALVGVAMGEDGFTGEWNGEWQANSNNDDNDDGRGGANGAYSMW